uniref:DUF4371 domain-containing protein n=1 Tax=Latimeria chalumnae TaxID=7897 RepID=H3AT60_LATCH
THVPEAQLIMDFITEDVQAFNIVEQPSFITLVKGPAPNRSFMCYEMLTEQVERAYENVKAKFEGMRTFYTAANIWIAGRSFLGIVVHWLDSSSLECYSVALACCRTKGHAYDHEEVRAAFRIHSKVCCTITNNGSNFIKAFKEFADFQKAEGDMQASEDEEEDAIVFLDLDQISATHTLHLVATKDSHDYLSTGPLALKKLFWSIIAKFSALWNSVKVIAEKAKTQLIDPNVTRWNSFYHAYSKSQNTPEEVLHDLCDCLNLKRLREIELIFLNGNCHMMKSLACALDSLQGESKCFIGFLLTTISALQKKLEAMKYSLKFATPLGNAILRVLQKRFDIYFEDHSLIIANITIPQFQMYWI